MFARFGHPLSVSRTQLPRLCGLQAMGKTHLAPCILNVSEKAKLYETGRTNLEPVYPDQILRIEQEVIKKRVELEQRFKDSPDQQQQAVELAELFYETEDEKVDRVWHTPESQLCLAEVLLKIGDRRNAAEMIWSAATIVVRDYVTKHYKMNANGIRAEDRNRIIDCIATDELEDCWESALVSHSAFYNDDQSVNALKKKLKKVSMFVAEFPKIPPPALDEEKTLKQMKKRLEKKKKGKVGTE